jgi:hypothetical protein
MSTAVSTASRSAGARVGANVNEVRCRVPIQPAPASTASSAPQALRSLGGGTL